jgi:hypothetical protein
MLQCLSLNNYTYQYYRSYYKKTVLTKNNALKHYLKNEEVDSVKYLDLFCLILSIIGDGADEFEGIYGIAQGRMVKMLPELDNIDINILYDNIKNETKLFSNIGGTNNKLISKIIQNEDIITRNLKLSSFELLSQYLNDESRTEIIEKKKKIQAIVENKNKISNWTVLHYGLNNLSMESLNISDQVIQNLF